MASPYFIDTRRINLLNDLQENIFSK